MIYIEFGHKKNLEEITQYVLALGKKCGNTNCGQVHWITLAKEWRDSETGAINWAKMLWHS